MALFSKVYNECSKCMRGLSLRYKFVHKVHYLLANLDTHGIFIMDFPLFFSESQTTVMMIVSENPCNPFGCASKRVASKL